MKSEATGKQISHTPFHRVWKHGFTKQERKLIKRALRLYLATLDDDTQKWRNVRTILACMGEDHIASRSEIETEVREHTRMEIEA